MKKTTKGAIAAGAAAVLLAGGAGSFAAWNASTTGSGGAVTAGSMSIKEVADSSGWTWADSEDEFKPGTDRIVPGDKVEYTATYEIDMVGTNLKAELAPSLGNVSGDLKGYLNVAAADGTQTTFETGEDGTLKTTVEYTTVIEFPSTTGDTDGAGLSAELGGSSVTLEQVAPASNNS